MVGEDHTLQQDLDLRSVLVDKASEIVNSPKMREKRQYCSQKLNHVYSKAGMEAL